MEDFITQLKQNKPHVVKIASYEDNLSRAIQLYSQKRVVKPWAFFTKARVLVLGVVVLIMIAIGLFVLLPKNANPVQQSSNVIPAKDTDNTEMQSVPTLVQKEYKIITPTPTAIPSPYIAKRCRVYYAERWNVLKCNYVKPDFTAEYLNESYYPDFDLILHFTMKCGNIYGPEASDCKVWKVERQACTITNEFYQYTCLHVGGNKYKLYDLRMVSCAVTKYPLATECEYI